MKVWRAICTAPLPRRGEVSVRLLDSCRACLTDHPGVLFFGSGRVVDDLNRPVNVKDFEVGVHVVFENREAHDVYQTSERHVKFLEENKANWEQARVFDSYVQ